MASGVIMDFLALLSGASWTTYILTVILMMITYSYLSRKPWLNLPPGPPTVPILGSIPFMRETDQRLAFNQMRKKYGDVFTVHIGYETLVVVNGYKAIRETLIDQSQAFAGRPLNYFLQGFMRQEGLLGGNGKSWKINRQQTVKHLKTLGYGKSAMEQVIMGEAENMLEQLKVLHDNPGNVVPIFMRSSYNILTDLAFGKDHFDHDPRLERFLPKMHELVKLFSGNNTLSYFPYLRYLPIDIFGMKKVDREIDEMIQLCADLIEHRRKALAEEESDEPYDVVGMFFRAREKAVREGTTSPDDVNDEALVKIVKDLHAAATDTIAVTLTWGTLSMSLHQEIQEKVYAEISEKIGTSRPPRWSDQTELPYTAACISEIQRIADIVPLIPRAVVQDTTLNGYTIPKWMPVLLNVNTIHHDPEVWPDPFVLNPERFLDEGGKYKSSTRFVPFGGGPRLCLGDTLAKAEVFLLFTSIIQRYKLNLAKGTSANLKEGTLGIVYSPKVFKLQVTERQ